MIRKTLILWGGGHLVQAVKKLSSDFEFVDQLVLVSRDPSAHALAERPEIVMAKSFGELGDRLLEGAVVLATRPFSSWLEELGRERELGHLEKIKKLLMISSTGVYVDSPAGAEIPTHGDVEGIIVDEDSAVKQDHPYIAAETEISEQLPTLILRCAGLYDELKGPHCYYLRKKAMPGPTGAHLNLIHYDDLARVVTEVLKREFQENSKLAPIYNISDGTALTRSQIHQHLKSWGGEWAEIAAPIDEQSSNTFNKIVKTKIWSELGLEPKYKSFLEFNLS